MCTRKCNQWWKLFCTVVIGFNWSHFEVKLTMNCAHWVTTVVYQFIFFLNRIKKIMWQTKIDDQIGPQGNCFPWKFWTNFGASNARSDWDLINYEHNKSIGTLNYFDDMAFAVCNLYKFWTCSFMLILKLDFWKGNVRSCLCYLYISYCKFVAEWFSVDFTLLYNDIISYKKVGVRG